jgi:hypothetical protein
MIGWEGIFCGQPRSTDSDSFPDTGWFIYDPTDSCSDASFDVTIGECTLPGVAVFQSCCDPSLYIRIDNIPSTFFPITTNSYYLSSLSFNGCITKVSSFTPASTLISYTDDLATLIEQLGDCSVCLLEEPCPTPTPTVTPTPSTISYTYIYKVCVSGGLDPIIVAQNVPVPGVSVGQGFVSPSTSEALSNKCTFIDIILGWNPSYPANIVYTGNYFGTPISIISTGFC